MTDSNELIITLLPGQQQMINLPDTNVQMDICCYQGGFGSGKTRGGVDLGLLLAEKYQGVPGLVCGMTYPLVRDTTLTTYFEAFEERGYIDGRDYEWVASKQVLRFPKWGNSVILFRHLDNPSKLKSLNLGWVHMEEMSEADESAFVMLLSRLRHKKMARHRLFGTTNPQATKGWIHDYFVARGGITEEIVDGQPVRINYRRVLAPSTQNTYLSSAYLLNMKQKFDPEYYRINVLGEDGDYTAGLVSYSFSDLNIKETEYRADQDLYLTCDFNVDPMSWACAHIFNKEFHFFDEIVIENTNITECVDEFIRRYPDHQAKIIITGDASGNNRSVTASRDNKQTKVNGKSGTAYTEMLNRFTERHYPAKIRVDIKGENPAISARVSAWNAAVCNQEGIRRVFIHPRCRWLIWNCENLKYQEGSGKIEEPTSLQIKADPKKKFTKHIWDGASYLVEKEAPIVLVSRRVKECSVTVPKALNDYFNTH